MKVTIRYSTAPEDINNEAIELSHRQAIIWSDDLNKHYFLDFPIGKYWVTSHSISNDLKSVVIDVY